MKKEEILHEITTAEIIGDFSEYNPRRIGERHLDPEKLAAFLEKMQTFFIQKVYLCDVCREEYTSLEKHEH